MCLDKEAYIFEEAMIAPCGLDCSLCSMPTKTGALSELYGA